VKSTLICNEDPGIRLSLKRTLKTLGFDEIIECADGETAVRLTLDRLPDIVMLDLAMPKKDGIAAAGEIRRRLKIPVILVAAAADGETMERAKRTGVASFLMKPLRDQDIWPAIEP
jgi:two-component system, response regulator PdtaR